MSATIASTPRPIREPRNGVNTPVRSPPSTPSRRPPRWRSSGFAPATAGWTARTAKRASNRSAARGRHTHQTQFRYAADHPAVLVGQDRGPTPVEFLLHGLAACITAGIGNIAAARGVTLTSVESQVEGDIDLRGILGSRTQRPQRLRADPHQLHDRRRRAGGEAARDCRAVARAIGGLRCADQRRAG